MSDWVPISDALYETEIRHCDFCGKMMTKRYWQVTEAGRTFSFCDPDCEFWWRDYWVPRYGETIGLEAAAGFGGGGVRDVHS